MKVGLTGLRRTYWSNLVEFREIWLSLIRVTGRWPKVRKRPLADLVRIFLLLHCSPSLQTLMRYCSIFEARMSVSTGGFNGSTQHMHWNALREFRIWVWRFKAPFQRNKGRTRPSVQLGHAKWGRSISCNL